MQTREDETPNFVNAIIDRASTLMAYHERLCASRQERLIQNLQFRHKPELGRKTIRRALKLDKNLLASLIGAKNAKDVTHRRIADVHSAKVSVFLDPTDQ